MFAGRAFTGVIDWEYGGVIRILVPQAASTKSRDAAWNVAVPKSRKSRTSVSHVIVP